MNTRKTVRWLLRISIASVFLYATIAATLQPGNWVSYFPLFLTHMFSPYLLLHGFSLFQALLAVWILTGWKGFYAGLVSSVTLIAIIVANLTVIDILFRDIAIFFAALALALDARDS